MTTPVEPLEGIAMPFAATLIPVSGSTSMTIPVGQQNRSGFELDLPPGVSVISTSYAGSESIEVRFSPDGAVTQQPLTLPTATDGTFRSKTATVGVPGAGAYLYFRMYPAPTATTLSKKLTATVSVYPTTPPAA